MDQTGLAYTWSNCCVCTCSTFSAVRPREKIHPHRSWELLIVELLVFNEPARICIELISVVSLESR